MGRLVQQQALLEPIGNIPPAEAEEQYHAIQYYAMLDDVAMAA